MSGKLKKAGGIILIIAILGIELFCFIKKNFENPLKNIPQESSEIPSYVAYGSLYSDYGKTYVNSICRKNGYYLLEILCVKDGKVYFIYSGAYEEKYYWMIGDIDLVTLEFHKCYDMADPAESYEIQFWKNYKERNGYYLDGKIVLNDHQTVLEYDIESQNLQTYDYHDYNFPKRAVYGEYIDYEAVRLNLEDSVRTYTLEEMAEKSDSIAQILALKEKKIWCGDSYLWHFFTDDNLQFIGDKVYTIGNCFNYWGEAFAVMFEYDVQEDSWKYVTSYHMGSPARPYNCYVIPTE